MVISVKLRTRKQASFSGCDTCCILTANATKPALRLFLYPVKSSASASHSVGCSLFGAQASFRSSGEILRSAGAYQPAALAILTCVLLWAGEPSLPVPGLIELPGHSRLEHVDQHSSVGIRRIATGNGPSPPLRFRLRKPLPAVPPASLATPRSSEPPCRRPSPPRRRGAARQRK